MDSRPPDLGGSRLTAVVGLIGDAVLPLAFLAALLLPDRYSMEEERALGMVLAGEVVIAAVIVLTSILRRVPGILSVLPVLTLGFIYLFLCFAVFRLIDQHDWHSPVLAVLVAVLARYFGIVRPEGSPGSFPHNVWQAFLAVGLLWLTFIGVVTIVFDGEMERAYRSGTRFIALIGLIYFGMIFAVRLCLMLWNTGVKPVAEASALRPSDPQRQ